MGYSRNWHLRIEFLCSRAHAVVFYVVGVGLGLFCKMLALFLGLIALYCYIEWNFGIGFIGVG